MAVVENAVVDGEAEIGKIGDGGDCADERGEDVADEGVDDAAEGGPDHDAYGEVEDVAAENELFEFFEHGYNLNDF